MKTSSQIKGREEGRRKVYRKNKKTKFYGAVFCSAFEEKNGG
jgi:hypothetical protein